MQPTTRRRPLSSRLISSLALALAFAATGWLADTQAQALRSSPLARPVAATTAFGGGTPLVLDDGTAEETIGLTTGTGEFLWFNHFSPPAADFPLSVTEVSVLFTTDSGCRVGDALDVYIYSDPDDDPANGATLVDSETGLTIQTLDAFSTYTLSTPVEIATPGGVLIGVVNRGCAAGKFPAALDQGPSQRRSWVATYAGPVPGSPPLPAPELYDLIDAFGFPGNWMIRGSYVSGGGGGCEQELSATLDDDTPAPGQTITFTATITNNATTPTRTDLWLTISGGAGGPRVQLIGSFRLPPGATVTRNVRTRISSQSGGGTFTAALNIGDFDTGNVCDAVTFTITVAPPRVGTEAASGVPGDFFVVDAADARASAVIRDAVADAVAPNPFARQTTIQYAVEAPAAVRLAVYDVLGREVAVLVDGRQEAGAHRATFDAQGLAVGTYVYRLTVGNEVRTGRLTLAY